MPDHPLEQLQPGDLVLDAIPEDVEATHQATQPVAPIPATRRRRPRVPRERHPGLDARPNRSRGVHGRQHGAAQGHCRGHEADHRGREPRARFRPQPGDREIPHLVPERHDPRRGNPRELRQERVLLAGRHRQRRSEHRRRHDRGRAEPVQPQPRRIRDHEAAGLARHDAARVPARHVLPPFAPEHARPVRAGVPLGR